MNNAEITDRDTIIALKLKLSNETVRLKMLKGIIEAVIEMGQVTDAGNDVLNGVLYTIK